MAFVKKLGYLSRDLHIAIAKVTIEVAQLEYWLEKIIDLSMRRQQHTAKALLDNLSTDRMVSIAAGALIDMLPDERSAIDNAIKDVRSIRTERNEVVHWIWEPTNVRGIAANARVRPFKAEIVNFKSAHDVDALAIRAAVCAEKLMNWYYDAFNVLLERNKEERALKRLAALLADEGRKPRKRSAKKR